MSEFELKSEGLSNQDNTTNVEMTENDIWFLKHFIKEYHPKKIIEVGISAGGNTVNLLQWKDKDAQLFSVDIANEWYRDNSKLSGWMADELEEKDDNWTIYRGYDYLDVWEEIGDGIDFIIIDTVHAMPGEFLTFIAALPQLKDGCIVVLHDVHLNLLMINNDKYNAYRVAAHCTGLLFGGVTSAQKWTVKSGDLINIGAFIVGEDTRENIKDIFHILCAKWFNYPYALDMDAYLKFIKEHYSTECYNLFKLCIELQLKYFNHVRNQNAKAEKNNAQNKLGLKNSMKKIVRKIKG